MLEFLRNPKTFLNKGTNIKKMKWNVLTQNIKILKLAYPLNIQKTVLLHSE